MKAKKVVIVLAGVMLVAVFSLAVINSQGNARFRHDAVKWAQPTIDQTNMITSTQLEKLTGNTLLVDLSEQGNLLKDNQGAIHIPASVILEKENQKKLRTHEGNIVLISADRPLSARIWMLLSQMGYENLFILDDGAGNDVLKYKFQPDTITRPEFE
ncbi:MAG: rhodanese-like domain-containing protein [Bacteroidales bacterium]|nr:rhodanese-like domain-containing protein [Bacteroidales bacterium]